MGNTTALDCCFYWTSICPAQDPDSGRVGGAEVAGRQEQGPVFLEISKEIQLERLRFFSGVLS